MNHKRLLLLLLLFTTTCLANSTTQPSNEPLFSTQWYLHYDPHFYAQHHINKEASIHPGDYLKQYTGKGVKIAVIDDQLDLTHEDLQGAVIQTYGLPNTKTTAITTNHGTAVTGLIAARINHKGIRGIAPHAQIIFIQRHAQMSNKEKIELFEKAIQSGADIINCSWISFEADPSLRQKIAHLTHTGRDGKGVIIVFSVGNGNQNNLLNESSIPEVIAVGATDRHNKRAWYSNFGKNLDIMAPGGNFIGLPTLNGFNHEYLSFKKPNTFTGTSAAAPLVSGIIALMLEKNPNLTSQQVQQIIKKTADKVGDRPYIHDRNDYYGYGKINLTRIMKMLDTIDTP